MSLEQSFEKQGNFLFKYRGQFPIILFLLAIPFIYSTDLSNLYFIDNKIFYYILISILFILGFIIRCYTIGTTPSGTSGRNTKSQIADSLNTDGVYSIIRHPLYLGNYLIWLSIAIYTYSLFFPLFMSLLFWLYYERIMFAEEKFLEKKFGDKFINWSNLVPAFFPKKLVMTVSPVKFSFKSVLRREYASYLSAISAFLFIDIVRIIVFNNMLFLEKNKLIFFIVSIIIVLILRTLKHYTLLLNESDRS
jgi:protein-S-isoprenylcysteine O-methyltransferase Ste14